MGSSCPSHIAQPFGAKLKLMMRISDRKGSAIVRTPPTPVRGRTVWPFSERRVLRLRACRASCISAAGGHGVAGQDSRDGVAVRQEGLNRSVVVVRTRVAGQPDRCELRLAHSQVYAAIGLVGRVGEAV